MSLNFCMLRRWSNSINLCWGDKSPGLSNPAIPGQACLCHNPHKNPHTTGLTLHNRGQITHFWMEMPSASLCNADLTSFCNADCVSYHVNLCLWTCVQVIVSWVHIDSQSGCLLSQWSWEAVWIWKYKKMQGLLIYPTKRSESTS
jgi:hypothetical protein